MKSERELKPCPFCGREDPILETAEIPIDSINDEQYRITCSMLNKGCGAHSGWYMSEDSAAMAWNRRAVHDPETVPVGTLAVFLAGYAMPPDLYVQAFGGYEAMSDVDERTKAWEQALRETAKRGES